MRASFRQGKGSLRHNNREFISSAKNIDVSRISDNITYVKQDLTDAYKHLFEDAVKEYVKKTKPSRRQYTTAEEYLEYMKHSSNKQKPFYEIIVEVGDKFTAPCNSDMGECCKEILDEYMRNFQARNPNLYVFNAVLHLDEAVPHLHIDYIPWAECTRGMPVKSSLTQALESMSDVKINKADRSRYNNYSQQWRLQEREVIRNLCLEHGITLEAEVSTDKDRDLTIGQYKAMMEHLEKITNQLVEKETPQPRKYMGVPNPRDCIQINKDIATENVLLRAYKKEHQTLIRSVDHAVAERQLEYDKKFKELEQQAVAVERRSKELDDMDNYITLLNRDALKSCKDALRHVLRNAPDSARAWLVDRFNLEDAGISRRREPYNRQKIKNLDDFER